MDIIWIHGFGEDSSVWDDFIPQLPIYYSNFVFDFSATTGHTTIKDYAVDLRNFIGENKIKKPVLIGHSMGGYIALEYVFTYTDEVSGLGLFHSSAAADSEAKKGDRNKTIAFIRKNGSEVFIKNFYPNMFSVTFRDKYADLVESNNKRFQKLSTESLISATESMKNRKDYTDSLSELPFPVFQILGKQDSFVPLDTALKQTALLQKPYTLVLDNAAHAGMYEAKEISAEFISYFLERIRPLHLITPMGI